MEKLLQLYKFVDGVNDTPFPNASQQAILYEFRYDAKRMGAAPTISGTIMHPQCLDDLWGSDLVYVTYNDERYFLKQTPTSSYSNEDTRYKHELNFVSERAILNSVYFYDVVASDVSNDKPVSNSSNVTFFGDIHEFAQRLNYSLQYAKVDYSVVVDEGISSGGKLISFQDQFIANALQEVYNTYEIPYYFVGKVIHIGFTDNAITHTFKYGVNDALLSIQKTNANYKITNRVTGIGSEDNIPYYYPNKDEKGVSKALYNNSDSGVSIQNENRYKKVKLSDVFTYTNIARYNHTICDGSNHTFDNELVETSPNIWEIWQVHYPFTIDKVSDSVDFNIRYLGSDLEFINIEVWNGGQRIATNNKEGEFSRRCGVGDYELRISVGVYSDEFLPKSYADTIISRISVSVTQVIDGEIGWYLNDKRYNIVQLSDYGLSVSATPSHGDNITFIQESYIKPQTKLMPPIYRETSGEERFYNALNKTYISPQTNDYYTFENPFVEGKPKEHIVTFEDIKPSIVGMTNANGLRIDMFSDFAYDNDDNDEFDEEGNYLHPYFFAKLRKFDGDYGFNLFDHAIEEGEMTISMTSGSCGACNFIVGVDDETQKNIVQVDENGNLLRDSKGNVLFGKAQDRQNDTSKYEVWIALKKDIDTFGVIIPNAAYDYKPKAGDTFVILHIDLPFAYIAAAENSLKEEIIKYMAMNNSEKFTFSITFSRIFFEENPSILAQLNENARLQIEYNEQQYELYVSSFSYLMSENKALPEIRVELSDTLTIAQNALQNSISEVKSDIMNSVGSIDWARIGLKYFLRKDTDDRSKGKIASDTSIEVGRFVSGASGAIVYVDKTTGQTIAELDKLYVRMKAYFEQLDIVNVNSVGGKQILSPAGALRISNVVDNGGDYYRCYFLNEQDGETTENRFKVGDQAYCELFNAKSGVLNNISNKYYWRLVVGVGEDYIDLSKSDCDNGSDIPQVGDVVCHKGNRNDVDRQNLIEISSVDSYSPSIILYQGINNYSLKDKDLVSFGVDKATNKAFFNVYGDMYIGDREKNSFVNFTQKEGLKLKGKLEVGSKISDALTVVEDGVIQSTLLKLGYFEDEVFKIMSGTNGLYDPTQLGGGIAAWYGGPMVDRETDDGLVEYAQSLFRFDGSGYLAGGNIAWDKDGAGSVAGGDIKWDKDGAITLGVGIKISGDANETLGSILNLVNKIASWFGEDKDTGAIYVKKKGSEARDFYTYGAISFGGVGEGSGGTGGGSITSFDVYVGNDGPYPLVNGRVDLPSYPTALKSPHALTINGTSYDGSEAVNIEVKAGIDDTQLSDYAKKEWVIDNYTTKEEFNPIKSIAEKLDEVIGIDENGAVYIKKKTDGSVRDFYTYGAISFGGVGTSSNTFSILVNGNNYPLQNGVVELPDYPTELANPYALTINGTTYDGSEAVNIEITGGTADMSNYLSLDGGTMKGAIVTKGDDSVVIKPAKDNCDQIGASDYKFWKMHASLFIGDLEGTADSAKYATSAGSADNATSADSADYATEADTLDGYHAERFLLMTGRDYTTMDLNTIGGTQSIFTEIRTSEVTTTNSPLTGYGALLSLKDRSGIAKMQLLGAHNSAQLYFRAQQGANTNITTNWKTIAFTDSVVDSAKKLVYSSTVTGLTVNSSGDVVIQGTHLYSTSAHISDLGTSTTPFRSVYTRYIDTYSGYDLRLCTGGTEQMRITAASGCVILGGSFVADNSNYKLLVSGNEYVNGNIVATGAITFGSASDRRLKDNIKSMTDKQAVAVLKALNPVTFEWNSTAYELGKLSGVSDGFIADEYEKLIPNSGRDIWANYRAINYERATGYLVKGWQKHQSEIERLKDRVKELENELKQYRRA